LALLRGLALALAGLRVGVDGRRVGGTVGELVEAGRVDVRDRVAGLVVAAVVRLAGHAAERRRLLGRLDALGAGEQPPRRDPHGDERPVVRAAVERRRRRREALRREVALKRPLDVVGAGGTGVVWIIGRGRAIAVVD